MRADAGGVEAAGALVGHVGEVVAVEDDDLPRGEGGGDEVLDVLAAVLEEEVEFLGGGEAAGVAGLAEAGAVRAVGRLAGEDDLVPAFLQGLGEHPGLGGLPGSVDSFEDDEHALVWKR